MGLSAGPAWARFEPVFRGPRGARYVSLFSCYDFRVEAERFGVTKQALQRIVGKVSQFPAHAYSHIRDLRVFGFRTIVVRVEKSVLGASSAREVAGRLPLRQFVSSIALPLHRRIYIAYSVPEELYGHIYTILEEELPESAVLEPGITLPVRNCTGSLSLEPKAMRELEEEYEALTAKPPRTHRPHILDYIIVSMLDSQPLLTLNKMKSLPFIAEDGGECSGELRYKYLLRHYRQLSSVGAVGRVRLSKLYWGNTVPLLAVCRADSAARLYAIAASVLATSRIVVGEEHVYVSLALPARHAAELLHMLPPDCDVVVLREGLRAPFPYEYYNPRVGRWQLERVNVLEELRRHRLLLPQ